MKTTLGKRMQSVLLTLVMVASLLPMPVMAQESDNLDGNIAESSVLEAASEGAENLEGGGNGRGHSDRSTCPGFARRNRGTY